MSGCHALKFSGPTLMTPRLDRLLVVHQIQELLAGLGIVPEHAQHRRGHCLAVDLLHASHHHAHVPATYAKEFFPSFFFLAACRKCIIKIAVKKKNREIKIVPLKLVL